MGDPPTGNTPSFLEIRQEAAVGERIDRYLSQTVADGPSRTVWQQWIETGRVRVNGSIVRPSYRLAWGDRVAIEAPDPPLSAIPSWQALDLPTPDWILYLDDAMIVVNKPAGLPVHPSRGHWDHSLVHYLLPWINPGEADDFRPGIVHRLDKDTTGCLVVARTPVIRQRLSAAIAQRAVQRWYLAIVSGHFDPPAGLIDAPVGRDPRQRLRMAVVPGGRPARTHYRTLMTWPGFSGVLLKLETGRTHQIRVHLASLGHPVVGDPLYHGNRTLGIPHQALHAWRLALNHPLTDTPLTFTAPLPADWLNLVRHLGEPAPVEAGERDFHDGMGLRDPAQIWQLALQTSLNEEKL